MPAAQISRIKRVGNYRAFQSWSDGGRPTAFKRVNVIYGTNGSGKSTLGELLQDCALQAAPATVGLQLDVEEGGRTSVVTESTVDFWARVRVFNRSYAQRSLRFDDDAGPNPDSLLTIGETNVANETELEEKREWRDKIREELGTARKQLAATEKQLQERLSTVAKTIAEELQPSQVRRYRGTNVYTKREVRARLDGDRSVLDAASSDVPADLAKARAARLSPVTLSTAPSLPADEASERVRRLLASEVTVTVLEELRGHGDRAEWVQKGIGLHESLDTCLFCGQALTAQRRDALEAHFDTALQNLQAQIDEQVRQLETAVQASKHYFDSLPTTHEVYADLTKDLADARAQYEANHALYGSAVDKMVSALRSKRSNPFEVPDLDASLRLSPPSTGSLDDVAALQKARSTAHATEVERAAERVELARIAMLAHEYDNLTKEIADKDAGIPALETNKRDLDDRIATLENSSADPVPKAEALTEDVARLLGRSELSFRTAPDGLHYTIERNGLPATHLSEGERTAIALLHFLASVQPDVLTGDEPILVIDDPVSSFDHEILFGASAFLWAGLVPATHIGQLFLLTHNFELFRQWAVQLERHRKEVPGEYTIHELRMRHEEVAGGKVRRVPQLEPWNAKLGSKLRSQYHFLFWRVARTLVDAAPEPGLAERMELLALAPNAARQMMEGFLSFRFPAHIGSFHGGMGAALKSVPDGALRNRIERYLHAYSHNEEGDISAMLDPSEATSVFRSLFELMNLLDAEHFSGMCAALGIEEERLLCCPPGTAD